MSITRISYGAFHNVFNAANQPSPGTFAIGDLLLVFTGEYIGGDLLATPAGWTLLSPNNNAKQTAIFGLVSVTGLEVMPSMSWGAQFSWAIVGVYRGVDPALTVLASGDRVSAVIQNIVGPSGTVTPPQANCLVLFVGNRDKTPTSNASVFSAPASFVVAAQQTQTGGGSLTANVICEWIQTTATAIAPNTAITGSVPDGANQANQGVIIVLGAAAAPPPPSTSVGYLRRPGNPALSSPTNSAQFRSVNGFSQSPPIVAPIAGQFSSNSTLYGAMTQSSPLNIGFVRTPGPGIGPFSNNQFETFTWDTSNPSPTTMQTSGVLVSNSTWYVTPSSTAGQLNGVWASSSTFYAQLDGLMAGSMTGIWASSSTAYTGVNGALDMSFALSQSNSTVSMLQIGGSFQPLVPFTAVVDVRLNIGYQPWKVHPEGTIG